MTYKDKIKVVGPDDRCWPVHPKTYEVLACSTYDPYPYQPYENGTGPIEIISHSEWLRRLDKVRYGKR